MYLNFALTIVLAIAIDGSHSVIADKENFDVVKPSPTAQLPDQRRRVNFKDNTVEERQKNNQPSETESEKAKDSKQDKQTRTIPGPLGADNTDNLHCCGSRYEVASPGRPESAQGGGVHGSSSDTGRYPSRYGSRPEDRYGWHSFTPGSAGRRGAVVPSAGPESGGGLYGGGYSGGDRYANRPSYYEADNKYDRPSNNGNRPGRPSYLYGYGGYGDSGAYGSNGYEISRPGSYGGGGGRPPGSINFGGQRPGGSYGGGHGVFGTIGEDGEFPGPDGAEGPDGPNNGHPNIHLQTQKAVALKALAGVALIGAAAALATNPVLLPIGVLAGRRKRSINVREIEETDIESFIKLLEDHVPKIYREKIMEEMLTSPTCVARLACEVQQEYVTGQNSNTDNETRYDVYNSLRLRLVELIQSNILQPEIQYKNIKNLIKSANAYDGNCNVFACDLLKD